MNFSLYTLGVIAGEVTDRSGSVIADQMLVDASLGDTPCSAESVSTAFVDLEDGSYRISQLLPGTYYLFADGCEGGLDCPDQSEWAGEWWVDSSENNYRCEEATPIEIDYGSTITGKNFALSTGNTLYGSYFNRDGESLSLPAAPAYLYRGLSACIAERVGSVTDLFMSGFSFTGLAPGIYFIQVQAAFNALPQWWSASGNATARCEDAEPIVLDGLDDNLEDLDFYLYDCSSYPDLPPNDMFSDAAAASGDSFSASGNNYCATNEAGEPDHAGTSYSESVWWDWSPDREGWYLLNTEGSTFNTVVGVYTGDTVDTLSLVAENNDGDGEIMMKTGVRSVFKAEEGIILSPGGRRVSQGVNGYIRLAVRPLAGDIDGNLQTGMEDPILGLQVATGSASIEPHLHGDVDADDRIGVPEVLYGLNTLHDLSQYGPCLLDDLAENNAGDWEGWAEYGTSGATYFEDDSVMKAPSSAGSASVKFITDGGWDTYARYPAYEIIWDLSQTQTVLLSLYAENPSAYNFQSGPFIRLIDADGDYFEYRPYQNGGLQTLINDAVDNWLSLEIPINALPAVENGWAVTLSGTPDISRIRYLEIHNDTWDSGFTLWIDEVFFYPEPDCCRPGIDILCE